MPRHAADDRVKLLHGPYRAPRLRVGDRATCLLRDCDVVVTSWSDAPIPWPRCRALDSGGGGSGLLLAGDLGEAVRRESAAAVRHWWAVSALQVWKWRKVLGVRRMENDGSRRLTLAASAWISSGLMLAPDCSAPWATTPSVGQARFSKKFARSAGGFRTGG